MKAILVLIMTGLSLSFLACSGNVGNTETDSDTITVDTLVCDTVSQDSLL